MYLRYVMSLYVIIYCAGHFDVFSCYYLVYLKVFDDVCSIALYRAWSRDWPLTWWTDQLLSFSALTLLVRSSDR